MPARPEPSESLHVEYQPSIPESNTARAADGVQYYGEAAVDIIAVQGLGSWYDWAWSVKTSSDGSRYFWLKDSIRHAVPHARVLAYDYNTDWFGDPNRITLEECGARLLRTIILNRTHVGRTKMCPCRSRRPIIFIGHSFGGLVIKQSLVLAAKTESTDPLYEDHRAYLSSVTSIMFLGTPHFGSSFLSLAKWKVRAGRLLGVRTDDNLLKLLELDSDLLRELQVDFDEVQKKPEMRDLAMYCYYETKDVKEGPISAGLVVTETSACLSNAICKGLEKDHMGLNKFKPLDREYEEVLKPDLIKCFQAADQVAHVRFAGQEYGSDSANPDLLNLHHQLLPVASKLNDRLEASLREIRPRDATGTTCDWIQEVPAFTSWRACHQLNVLWIHGKSGSGKSTLAAYVTRLLQPAAPDTSPYETPCTILQTASSCSVADPSRPVLYFLCGIEPASETPPGILGNLIHQLLMHYSNNWRLHAIATKARKRLQAGGDVRPIAQLLVELLNVVGGAYIVVDGLEENSRYQELLDALAPVANARTQLLFLSQNIYGIEQKLQMSFKEVSIAHFDITEHTKPDIDVVVEIRTAELIQSTPILTEKQSQIMQILKDDADGSFQHVVASIIFLQQGTVGPDEVESSLGGITNGTAEKYDRIMDYVAERAQPHDRQKIKSALMWTCVAATPLRSSHLLAMVHLGEHVSDMTLEEVEAECVTDKIAADRLKALLGSTIEFIESNDGEYIVQPCHASFRDYITDTSRHIGQGPVSTRHSFQFSRDSAHRACAVTSMSICAVSCLRLAQKERLAKEFNLEDYAWRFWSYHFKLSQAELDDKEIQPSFNRMLKWVSGDMLSVLEGLSHFASGRFQINEIPRKHRLNFVRSFQEAQRALVTPMRCLADLRGQLPVAQKLDEQRKLAVAEALRLEEGADVDTTEPRFIHIALSHARSHGLDTFSSELERVQLSQILTGEQGALEPSKLMVNLAETARALRRVAARFAVDPVYTQITGRSQNGEPTIITMLVAVAHMFDCISSFPYWPKLPASIDPLLVYLVPAEDSYAVHASAVLFRVLSTERTTSTSLVGSSDTDHEPSSATLSPRLDLTPASWYRAQIMYSMFDQRPSLIQTFIKHPVANYQMRRSMHLDFDNSYMLSSPRANLLRRAPQQITVGTFIRSIPGMMPAFFAQYVVLFTRAVDPWLWPFLQFQWLRITMSRSHFQLFWYLVSRTRGPNAIIQVGPWIFGFALYMLRRRYIPWFGAHMSPHPWTDTKNAFQYPEKYFEASRYSWTQILVNGVSHTTGHSLFAGAQVWSVQARLQRVPTALIPQSYLAFWSLCTLERGFCQGVNASLYPFAIVTSLFQTPGFLKWTICFTVVYWLFSFLGMLQTIAHLGLVELLGGWGIALGLVSYIMMVWWMVSYSELVMSHVSEWLTPVADGFMFVAHGVLKISIPILEVIAVLITGVVILWGLSTFAQLWEDPLDLRQSVTELQEASVAARATLREYQPYRIEGGQKGPFKSPAASFAGDVRRHMSRAARKYLPHPKME